MAIDMRKFSLFLASFYTRFYFAVRRPALRLPQSKNDLGLGELLLHPELLSECLILSKKLHREWTRIRGADHLSNYNAARKRTAQLGPRNELS